MATLQSSSSSIQEQQEEALINGCYTNRIEPRRRRRLIISPSTTMTKDDHVNTNNNDSYSVLIISMKLHAIKEAIADRIEMHKNIGEQRSQWNIMLLISINFIILGATIMTSISTSISTSTSTSSSSFLGLKLCSILMNLGATGLLIVMNKLQPSQLAEEQRNASRLFGNLLHQIDTTLSIGQPVTTSDVSIAMEHVLALDKAYPLPLIGKMIDKFPRVIEPAIWWPQRGGRRRRVSSRGNRDNGWNVKLEEEMRRVTKILEGKDQEEYIRLGENALKLNKFLAILGPLLTGVATIGSALVGWSSFWGGILGVVPGGLAIIVNTIQHGGQVGMVFEMYRSNAGFFKCVKESIESNLMEKDVERRENGEVFEMKLALKLGRSVSELREHVDTCKIDEFASKLF